MKISNPALEDFRYGPPVEPIEDLCNAYLAEFVDCYRSYQEGLAVSYGQWKLDGDLEAFSERAAILDHDYNSCLQSLGSLYFSASGDKLF